MAKTTLILGYRFVIWMCIVLFIDIIIDPCRTGSTKNFSVNIIPNRGWIKIFLLCQSSLRILRLSRKLLLRMLDKTLEQMICQTRFWTRIYLDYRMFLNINIFEVDWNTKSRTCSGLTISTATYSYSFGFSGRQVTHCTTTTATFIYFICVHDTSMIFIQLLIIFNIKS